MSDINVCVFSGRLTRDAEGLILDSGRHMTKFGIANNRRYRDREETLFIDCVLFGPMAEATIPLLRKGRRVIVSGRFSERQWVGADGVQRKATSLIVNDLSIIDKNNGTQVQSNAASEATTEEDEFIPF